jgi:hypothetical protein
MKKGVHEGRNRDVLARERGESKQVRKRRRKKCRKEEEEWVEKKVIKNLKNGGREKGRMSLGKSVGRIKEGKRGRR